MTIHHCPKCDLAFTLKAEVEDHCWHDHPEFRHDYPATKHAVSEADGTRATAAPAGAVKRGRH